jgi:hypothetical protein
MYYVMRWFLFPKGGGPDCCSSEASTKAIPCLHCRQPRYKCTYMYTCQHRLELGMMSTATGIILKGLLG